MSVSHWETFIYGFFFAAGWIGAGWVTGAAQRLLAAAWRARK